MAKVKKPVRLSDATYLRWLRGVCLNDYDFPDNLKAELMLVDMAYYPLPNAKRVFNRWATGRGPCPYGGLGCRWRTVQFHECPEVWLKHCRTRTKPISLYQIIQMLDEACPGWRGTERVS